MLDELVRFSAVRDGAHREFMDPDAFWPDRGEHGIA
jgi:hypothetical protein